ncbi:hypothetical protein [Methylobacterium oryzae]|uniref:hypothetical protein n=1 Tax=Methylobacterium oryzae TaxID=334852 RepID=UPI001F324792|nr:hypothetical protein [Methylobacterium oryzae]UIN36294.1 hypothetical protein LXM90_07280 [Methylobacterium oryzae]
MNAAETFDAAREAVQVQHRHASIAQLLEKNRRLKRDNLRLTRAFEAMRADRNAETQRADRAELQVDRAERQARDMRRELDAIRERMRDARREVGAA